MLHVASHGFFAGSRAPSPRLVASTRSQPLSMSTASEAAPIAQSDALLRSGLVLAGANRSPTELGNGLLNAAELANMDLRGTQLAVLSACGTGTGDIRNGDGVLGLRRALVLAGARAQVLSLWQVDDAATTALMKAFYLRLRRGRPVGEALRLAKDEIRRRPKWSHPFYWSAFTVSGDATTTL